MTTKKTMITEIDLYELSVSLRLKGTHLIAKR